MFRCLCTTFRQAYENYVILSVRPMFWGSLTHEGVGTLGPVEGDINSKKYIEICNEHLWPVIAKFS